MSAPSGRFRRSDRLLQSRDFKRVALRGRRSSCREFVILVASAEPQPTGCVRLGVTTSRRVGNAIVRNRVKRAVREWFRASRGYFERDRDVVVIARRAASELSPMEIGERLSSVVRRSQERGR